MKYTFTLKDLILFITIGIFQYNVNANIIPSNTVPVNVLEEDSTNFSTETDFREASLWEYNQELSTLDNWNAISEDKKRNKILNDTIL